MTRILPAAVILSLLTGLAYAQTDPPVPELELWESHMLSFGATYCQKLADEHLLGDTYYDAMRVFDQIAAYTGNSAWLDCVLDARQAYLTDYLIPEEGHAPGYWVFTRGLRLDWEQTAYVPSKDMVLLLGTIGYATSDMPESWTEPVDLMREVAYGLSAIIDAQALGGSNIARRDLLATQQLGHLDQVYVAQTYRGAADHPTVSCRGNYDVTPFMAALAIDALIKYWGLTADVRIQPMVTTVLEFLWDEAWVAADESFWYENCKPLPADPWPNEPGAPDLNLLIAPGYAWLYERTSNTLWRDRADAIFAGGVKFAYLYGAKQFNQNYMLSFDYLTRRAAGGGGVYLPHLRTLSVSPGSTYASFVIGMPSLVYETDCAIVVKEGVTTIETITSTEGLASRILQTSVALTANTAYTATQSCTGAETDTNTYNFTTKATPAGGDRTVPIQVGDAPTFPDVARVTIRYDDNPALSTPATQQNASCPGACVVNLTLAAGRWYYRVERQDSGDNVLAVGSVQSLSIP